jgi:phosphatidylglycerol---prolipoprotein diacylglyceryl transferase
VLDASGHPVVAGYFHPTFLYELLWNLAAAAVLVWADRRYRLGHGRVFALYVALYCLGRVWIEMLRIDTAEHFLGLRLNVFTSIVVGLAAVAYLVWQRGRPRETISRGTPSASADGEAADQPAPGAVPRPVPADDAAPAESDEQRRPTES